MCGISGIIAPQAQRFIHIVQAMTDVLAHRGPDGSGILTFDECVLGHRRLSIVDLATGTQPMRGQGNTAITFNGELYGFNEIREKLDYPFRTRSDTEVLLALYEHYGLKMISHVPGMFAFALWDETKQTLLCARDRFGEKPLYYAIGDHGEFIFASEIKAILASGLVSEELDRAALAHYMQRLYVPVTRSIYTRIKQVPPGHTLLLRDGELIIRPYWELPDQSPISPADAEEKFVYLFDQAVQRQLVADVEIGAFLSGGLDSGSVVSVASRYSSQLKTFSFGFGSSINELPAAKSVALHFKTQHMEFEDHTFDIANVLETMAGVYDEPFADSSCIPTYLLSQFASKQVKVVLTGDGGDELLGGYTDPYLFLESSSKKRGKLWPHLLYFGLRCAHKLGFSVPQIYAVQKQLRLAQYKDMNTAHWNTSLYFSPEEMQQLGIPPSSAPSFPSHSDTVDDALRSDIRDYMPGDVLTKVDRAAMAWGLETRAPFLDKDLAEFCISLPISLKLSATEGKTLLRHTIGQTLPPTLLTLPKQGFGSPVQTWLRNPAMKELVNAYVLDVNAQISNYFKIKKVYQTAEEFSYKTWILLCLGIWLEYRTHNHI